MKNKILSVALVIFSPMIYYHLTVFFRVNVTNQILHLFAIKSITLVAIVFILADAVCSILTAFVTALPCGYLFGFKPQYITLLLLVTILGFPVFAFFTQTKPNNLVFIDFIWQCVSVVLFVYYFANIGYRRAVQKKGAAGRSS